MFWKQVTCVGVGGDFEGTLFGMVFKGKHLKTPSLEVPPTQSVNSGPCVCVCKTLVRAGLKGAGKLGAFRFAANASLVSSPGWETHSFIPREDSPAPMLLAHFTRGSLGLTEVSPKTKFSTTIGTSQQKPNKFK